MSDTTKRAQRTVDVSKIEVGNQVFIGEIPPHDNVYNVNLIDTLQRMVDDKELEKQVAKVRAAKTKEAYDAAKKKLPCFIPSSATTSRKPSPDDVHTGLIIIDIDGKDNEKSIDELRVIVRRLQAEHGYVIDYFLSPGGNGLKVFCGIEPSVDSHRQSFLAIDDIFTGEGIVIDQACKDPKRVHYLSFDPVIENTLIPSLLAWTGETIKPKPIVKKKAFKYKRNYDSDLTDEVKANLCLEVLNPDMDYQDWLNVGFACHATGLPVGVWDSWSQSGQGYKAGECERKYKSFSGGGITIATLVKMATDANGGKNPVQAYKNERKAKPAPAPKEEKGLDAIIGGNAKAEKSAKHQNDAKQKEKKAVSTPITDKHYSKGKYYILDHNKTEFIALGDVDIKRALRIEGYSASSEDGAVSNVDKIKHDIITKNHVHHVGAIAGRSIGLIENENKIRHLVTRQNTRPKAKHGDWSTIKRIIYSVLGDDQAVYFYAWMHRSRQQLEKQKYMQGHALVMAGDVGKGKSMLQEAIVGPMLGSLAHAGLYLQGKTTFNKDLISSELLALDDKGGGRDAKSRREYGDQIKMITAGSHSVHCHGKGVDGYMVNPLWRICVVMNDDDQALGAFPPIGEGDCDSVGDKILLLKCLGLCDLPFTGYANQAEKLGTVIKRELPAFAHFIDSYEIPSEIKKGNCRFGFDEYHHPDLIQTINQDSNERTMLSVTDNLLFNNRNDFSATIYLDTTLQRHYWTGTAKEWGDLLLADKFSPQAKTLAGELAYGDASKKAGKALSKIAKIADGRVIQLKREFKKDRQWKIWERVIED